jgi:hypothetical protein
MKLIATREGIVFFVTIKNEAYSKDTCGKDRSITACFFRKYSFFYWLTECLVAGVVNRIPYSRDYLTSHSNMLITFILFVSLY